MEPYWGEVNGHTVKYENEAAVSSFPYCTESSLNFSTSATAYSEDDAEYATGRRNKASRQDPLSHRIIEKRRRDRMNSCLADLSRLIPAQYQRKGRGRIEKTEIIEMAIRHLKHLQSECLQKDNDYRQGYADCMKEAAKFLFDSHMQDFCYRLIARLQEHCDEIMKNDCFKTRCHISDNISASSGSPHNVYHGTTPLSQFRDMLVSDVEHSNDQNDVKDLSFRNHLSCLSHDEATGDHNDVANICVRDNNGIITSPNNGSNSKPSSQFLRSPLVSSSAMTQQQHVDSSNQDLDSLRETSMIHDNSSISSPPLTNHHHHHRLFHHPVNSLLIQASRMRNFSESSHDIEHNNNYKYKNHIKERFNQDVHLHDEETSSEHGLVPTEMVQSEHSHSISDHSKDEDSEVDSKKVKISDLSSADIKSNITLDNIRAEIAATNVTSQASIENFSVTAKMPVKFTKSSSITTSVTCKSFSVPIFALHSQGTFYVPLNVDYNSLLPFLNDIDLLDRNYSSMPVIHPISINVNFTPSAPSITSLKNKPSTATVNAFASTPLSATAMLSVKPKVEAITNGCYSFGSYV